MGRIMSSAQAPDFTKMPYIIQSILLLLGPTLFAASVYMVLGRLVVALHAHHHVMIRPKWLTKVFVIGDLFSFCAQGGGAGLLMMAKTQAAIQQGNNIVIAGLGIQIAFFALFAIVALRFHLRIREEPTMISQTMNSPWEALLFVLYGSSVLILIRYAYRVAEYVEGSTGSLQQEEIWLYLFDAVPMALVAVLFTIFHPSRVLNVESMGRARLSSDASLEELGNSSRVRLNK